MDPFFQVALMNFTNDEAKAHADFLFSDEIKHFGMIKKVPLTMGELREAMKETYRQLFKEPLGFGKEKNINRLKKLKDKYKSYIEKLKTTQQELEEEINAIKNKINGSEDGRKLLEKLETLKKKSSETSIKSALKNLSLRNEKRLYEKELQKIEDGKNLLKLEKKYKAISDAIASTEKSMEMAEARLWSIVTTYTASVFEARWWKTGVLPPGSPKWMSDVLYYLKKAKLIKRYKYLGEQLEKISPDVAMLNRKISDAFIDYAKTKTGKKIGELSAREEAKIREEFLTDLRTNAAAGVPEAKKLLDMMGEYDDLVSKESAYKLVRRAMLAILLVAIIAVGIIGYKRYKDAHHRIIQDIANIADTTTSVGFATATQSKEDAFTYIKIQDPQEVFRQNGGFKDGQVTYKPDPQNSNNWILSWPAAPDTNTTHISIYEEEWGSDILVRRVEYNGTG